MLSNKRYFIARKVGEAVAMSNFVMMLNPKFRGPKFTWDNLYHIVDSFSRGNIAMQGDFGRDTKEMEEVSATWGKYQLDSLFKESGVKEWLELKKEDAE
jgi:hypothetical protein